NFSFGYQRGNNNNKSTLYSQNSNILAGEYFPYSVYDQEGESGGYNNTYNAAINYKKTFEKKGQELTADLFFTQRDGESTNWYLQQFFIPDTAPNYFQKTRTIDLNRNGNAQIDFVTPVGNGGRIETGYKFSYRSIGQDYSLFSGNDENILMEDTTQTNNFIFSEFINAAYFIYSNTFWKKFKMQVGLRAELANTFSDLESADTVYKNNYFNLFPSVHLKYDINEQHALQLSYSRRVSRPTVWQLNPFIDISDKQNLRKGNPNLRPEFANSLELGYMLNIKKSSLTVTAFYRQRSNLITRYTEVKEQEVDGQMVTYTMTSYENLNSSHNIGVELFYGQRIWKFWKINATGNFYRNIINSDDLIDENLSRDWAWGFRINQTFNLPKNWDFQLNFRYRSPSLTTGSMGWGSGGIGQGKRSANYSLNLGVKKGFLNNSLIVSLNIRDLLYSVVTKTHTYSLENVNGYDAWSEREHDGYRISLNISYKINNYKKRPEKLPMEEEMEGEI
ncbi:MAG: outer membrane beta-barrel family protein, partial [Bacteroidales bacterium]